MVQCYKDFCEELLRAGFSLGGGSDKGIYAVVPFDWTEQPENTAVRWHTGEPDTDPWEWRMRVLEERSDIAYAKVFFRTSGFITREWYPYFLAARRSGTFEDAWEAGEISRTAKQIYCAVRDGGRVAAHDIKRLAGLEGETSAHIEKALTDLQMKMFLTICGRRQKLNMYGEPYGWSSTVFCTPEEFWQESFEDLPDRDQAVQRIAARVAQLNPGAQERKIRKFIYG